QNPLNPSHHRTVEAWDGFLSLSQAWIGGLRASSVASYGNHVKASCHWVAFSAEAAGEVPGGGVILPSELGASCLHVKVWRLPEEGQELPSSAGLTLGPGGGPVDMLQFHPTADGILTSGVGKCVTVWDMGQQQPLTGRHSPMDVGAEKLCLSQPGLVSPDKKLRIFDPRAGPAASQSVPGHENNKDSRLLWMGASDCLISVGFSQMREREVKLWDTRKFSPCCAVLEASGSLQSRWQSSRDTGTFTAQRAGSITGQSDGAG
uniref:Coronin n=1 Tax=Meleagris gallopavo TaxID=9103 RepID=A0A803YE84_MELGA